MELWKIILTVCILLTLFLLCLSYHFHKKGEPRYRSIISDIFAVISILIGLYAIYLSQTVDDIQPNIILSSDSLELFIGDTYTLSAISNLDDISIHWNTNDEKIVVIDSNGELTAINEGYVEVSAAITYKNEVYVSSCNILVKKPTVDLSNTLLELCVGEEAVLSANTFPADIKTSWISDNRDIVSINNAGELIAVNEGKTVITASMIYNNIVYSTGCVIIVNSTIEENESDPSIHNEENIISSDETTINQITGQTPLSSIILVRLENLHGYLVNSDFSTLQGTGYSTNYVATSAGLNYDEVISVCSYSPFELIYNLEGKYNTLTGEIAFDDITSSQNDIVGVTSLFSGEAEIIFYVDNNETKPISFNTTDFPKSFFVDVSGANKLSIVISFPYSNFVLENFDKYFNIINAYLE